MILDKVLKTLEYDKVLQMAGNFAVLKRTGEFLLNSRPEENIKDATYMLSLTKEADKVINILLINPLTYFEDVNEILARSKVSTMLSFSEVLKVANALRSMRIMSDTIAKIEDNIPLLKEIAEKLYFDEIIEKEIFKKIISDDVISDTASDALFEIRSKIKACNLKIKDKLNSYVSSKQLQKYLQDNVVTSRNDRYVILVKSECRSEVKGLIHDYSSTKSTVYVEPIEIVETNNELRALKAQETNEIQRIMQELTERIALFAEQLIESEKDFVFLDSIFAKAKFAREIKAQCPQLNDNGVIKIAKGKHPLINSEKVVPIDIELGKDFNILLISGPNTGGKTVSMKMMGLFSVLAMSGFFLPCQDADIAFFDSIYCDIGDDQSIEDNLSTFSSHMKEIKFILENADNNTLVLIDELGTGTDPEEGAALALAVLEILEKRGTKGVITSHYSELKEFAMGNNGVMNASMEFDDKNFSPTYRLNIGICGMSKALDIAKRLGISDDVISLAKSKISSEKVKLDELIKSAENERMEFNRLKEEEQAFLYQAEEKVKELDKMKEKFQAEKEKFDKNSRAEARRLLNEKAYEASLLLEEIKKLQEKEVITGADVIAAGKLKNELKNKVYEIEEDNAEISVAYTDFAANELKVGIEVFIPKLNSFGEVENISSKKNEAAVRIGQMKVDIKIKELKKPSVLKKKKENKTKETVKLNNNKRSGSLVEIKLLGYRVPEAIAELESFLDNAMINSVSEVKIIHGIGTGILKKAITEYLKISPYIQSFRAGAFGEGEGGVTVAKLKE